MKTLRTYKFLNPDRPLAPKDITLPLFRGWLSISLINAHGSKKSPHFKDTLKRIPDPFVIGVESSACLAVFANLICPALIVFGFWVRLAIMPILGIALSGFLIVQAANA